MGKMKYNIEPPLLSTYEPTFVPQQRPWPVATPPKSRIMHESFSAKIPDKKTFNESGTNNALNNAIGARGLQREINKVRSKILIPIMTNQVKSITLTSEMLNDDYIFEKEKTLELNLLK